jgi:hypothetical protein
MNGRLRSFLLKIFIVSLCFISYTAFSVVPFRIISWSVNDEMIVVDYGGSLLELKKGQSIKGTPYRLQEINSRFITFSGDGDVGETIRIIPSLVDDQLEQRFTILPEYQADVK